MPVQLDLSSLTFLVVEDSAYMRTILRTMLQGFGARRIVEAEDGASGLEAMDRANPDILILDWVMPILDGADMVRMIRVPSNPFAYIPIIMVTGHTERSRIIEARRLGIHELLCKPISASSATPAAQASAMRSQTALALAACASESRAPDCMPGMLTSH